MIRPKKVQKLIEQINGDKKVKNIIIAIYLKDNFLFIYNIHKSNKIKDNYLDLRHNVNNFKAGIMVAVKFELVLRYFNIYKQLDIVKTYLFRFFKVYLINNPALSTMLTPHK